MNSRLLVCLALVLSGGLFGCSASISHQSDLTDNDGYQWGEAVGGFQMAASVDASNAVIHCWIRNARTNAIIYNDFVFGYVENVFLQVRQGTNWAVVNVEIFPGEQGAMGAIPGDTKVRWLQRGEIITNTWERRDTTVRLPHTKQSWNNAREPWLARIQSLYYARESSLVKITERDTFAIDLINTSWPTNIVQQGTYKIRVEQDFYSTSPQDKYPYLHDPRLTLYSPLFKLEHK
jgi:hypothetical protein